MEFEKMLLGKHKKKQNNVTRMLIIVNVHGSAGPIRFVVNHEDIVATVIDTTLKAYAREGRLPILGTNISSFNLYCPHVGYEALNPWDTIGSYGARNFMLCKNPQANNGVADANNMTTVVSRKGGGNWKAWFNKSLNLKICTH